MKKPQISHEVPKCLLGTTRKMFDYQYALVHLLEKDPIYINHFFKCKQLGIPIYLDNSLHELGEAIGGKILWKWIEKLEPETIFVPDVWQDYHATIVNARQWIQYTYPETTTPVAIVQGKNLNEVTQCYNIMNDLGYEKIAFSYGADFYIGLYENNDFKSVLSEITQDYTFIEDLLNDIKLITDPNVLKSTKKALGRVYTLGKLYLNNSITNNSRIHLLGCESPLEFFFYKTISFIESIDTSNPIMRALDKNNYPEDFMIPKPKSNMNECFNMPCNKVDWDLVNTNILDFKNIWS